jgi:hypothetical protein
LPKFALAQVGAMLKRREHSIMRKISAHWVFAVMAVGVVSVACESGGVGDPCVPEDEYQTEFSGYSVGEVNVVNGFQGRVSCPYGQTQEALDAHKNTDPGNGALCRVPGTLEVINVPVQPQLVQRRPEDAVYCSCRCANARGQTDDGARYCECPSGYTCTRLVDDLGLGQAQLAGSYCIKQGSMPRSDVVSSPECALGTPDGVVGHCGNNGVNP